jgi:isochorismate hydrolase
MAEKPQAELDVIKQLADFRQRVVNGETVSDEELRDAIEKLKTFRDKTATPIKATAQKKAAKSTTKKEVADFFGDLL